MTVPPVIFGTSCLGNLYEVVPDETKLAIVAEIIRHSPAPEASFRFNEGKYGAGLALEVIGRALRRLGVPASKRLSLGNKLGWYRMPLSGTEPTFERGVWAGSRGETHRRSVGGN